MHKITQFPPYLAKNMRERKDPQVLLVGYSINTRLIIAQQKMKFLQLCLMYKTHRCFLHGRRFKVIADHAALKRLINVKSHQCARLTRWVPKLTQYEFEVLHRPGKKHLNAGVLSRHVAAVERNNQATADMKPQQDEVIRRAQSNDDFCQQVSQAFLKGKS
jgi:hypothetical protein